jgi:hypothetical protein
MKKTDIRQLSLPLEEKPKLRVIQGLGQRVLEPLKSRDAVARVLIEAGADMLLKRISPERAEFIEGEVDEVLRLFDRVDREPALLPMLEKKLDALEALMQQTRNLRQRRRV